MSETTETQDGKALRAAIGRRIKELREARKFKYRQAAEKTPSADFTYWKRIEDGDGNVTADVLEEIITKGLETDIETFFAPFVGDDKARESEERLARGLLERLLLDGAARRSEVINALKVVSGDVPPLDAPRPFRKRAQQTK